LKCSSGTIFTSDVSTFSDDFKLVAAKPFAGVPLAEAVEQIQFDPNPSACTVVTVLHARFDDIVGCEALTKRKCQRCNKLVDDEGKLCC
jgi:hypothetical protein